MSAEPPRQRKSTWAVFFEQPMAYLEAQAMQERVLDARIAGEIPDTLLFLQHTAVITLGRRGRKQYLTTPPDVLQQQGVEVVTSTRGGDVTYHGPGQAVIYPIVSVNDLTVGSQGYLSLLEELAIATVGHYGIQSIRREGMAGAWTPVGKIAAIGFRLKRWVSYHGMSLNVDLDLSAFDAIVGCGLVGEAVTSMQKELGAQCPSVHEVQQRMAEVFAALAGVELEPFSEHSAPAALRELL